MTFLPKETAFLAEKVASLTEKAASLTEEVASLAENVASLAEKMTLSADKTASSAAEKISVLARPPTAFVRILNLKPPMKLISTPRSSTIEPLETRIAPAIVFAANGLSATFDDVDGDQVTVKVTKGTLDATNFTFGLAQPAELQKLTLGAEFDESDLIITVKAGVDGNGMVNVGQIDATGVDLKNVSIAGDLGRINAGGGLPTAKVFGVAALTVDSMGRGGVALQGAGGSVYSTINGALGKLTVKGDIYHSQVGVEANIGSVTLGGSLIGGADAGSGLIISGRTPGFADDIGAVKIGGSIVGGTGPESGQLFSVGNIASLTIGGDIAGGTGNRSGSVFSENIGVVTVKGSILGNALAERTFTEVGAISAFGSIKSLTVGGDIIGGGGKFGGYVWAFGSIGTVKITGDVRGDNSVVALNNAILDFAASFNGGVQSAASIGSVSVGGSVIGGLAHYSGVIFVGNEDLAGNQAEPGVDLVGDIATNNGINVGFATAGNIGTVTIKGSVIGGGLVSTFPNGTSGGASGWVKADGSIGAVKITGDVIGAVGQYSGAIQARGVGVAPAKTTIASISVGGSVRGGQGYDSGALFAGSPDVLQAQQPFATSIGSIKITGSLYAGFGNISGTLYADGGINSVSIGGSIFGDPSGALDGVIQGGGAIVSGAGLGTVSIKGGVYGEFGPAGGGIYAYGGGIKSISIGRDLTGSTASTGIYATGAINSISVGGSILGAAPGGGAVFILSDTAISKLSVKGRVENADILAGSDFYNAEVGAVANADAQIGTVSVGLDWVASNLAAGVDSSDATHFGSPLDQTATANSNGIASRIASITIKGNVSGTPGTAGDGFGFFAQEIDTLKIRGVAQTLPPAGDSGTNTLGDPVSSDVVVVVFGGN